MFSIVCGRGAFSTLMSFICVHAVWEQFEKWIEGVSRVMCYDLCNACDGSVIEMGEAGEGGVGRPVILEAVFVVCLTVNLVKKHVEQWGVMGCLLFQSSSRM